MYISDRSTGGREFHGIIDEVRISTIGRDIYWINSSYINQKNTSSFYIIGNQQVFNNPPYKPHNPYPENGSLNVSLNITLSWIGGDPDGDPVTYTIYFGNNSPPPKVVDNQTNTKFLPEDIDFNSTYYWQIIAWDKHGIFTKGPIWLFKTCSNHPPKKPRILGYPFGKPGIKYNFRTQLLDHENDTVYYMWDWGDGSYSCWIGPFESGKYISASHAWSVGKFELKVKVKDVHDSESEWSDPLNLVIENEPPYIKITKPEQALYIRNKKILPRFFRKTYVLGKIDIIVETTDEFGVKNVDFYINDELKSIDRNAPYIFTWTKDDKFFHKHKYIIKVVAFDNAGNRAINKLEVLKFL
jgi:hypothetical protein